MDMLNANEAAEEAQGDLNGNKQAKGKGKVINNKKDESRAAPAVEDSEEEMDDVDQDIDHEMDHEMDQDESESEEDDDEEDRHERLLGFVGSLGDKAAAADRAANDRRSSQLLKEGEFNPTAVASGGVTSGGGASRKGGVSIEVRGKWGRHQCEVDRDMQGNGDIFFVMGFCCVAERQGERT